MIAEDRAPMIKQPEVGATYDAFLNKPEVSDISTITITTFQSLSPYITIIINIWTNLSHNRCAVFT